MGDPCEACFSPRSSSRCCASSAAATTEPPSSGRHSHARVNLNTRRVHVPSSLKNVQLFMIGITLAIGACLLLAMHPTTPLVGTRDRTPTIHQIQALSSLVTTRIVV